MLPLRPLLVFVAIAVGATTLIATSMAPLGLTVTSPQWALIVPFAMWAPAFGRFVARRTVDREFTATLPVRRWGRTGAFVLLRPLAFPLIVYGASYAIAWAAGFAQWNPGEGRWTGGRQIAGNLIVNLPLLGIIGTFTAMGEELGWRGYLQPRLDAAGVRSSLLILWIVQVAYHAPLIVGAGYVDTGGLATSLLLFAIGDLPITFIMARESYMAGSLWPAIFFHSFHNTISQWLFPKFLTVPATQLWVNGEQGILPMLGYVLLGTAMYIGMRRRGETWASLASQGVGRQPGVRIACDVRQQG